MMNFNHFVFVFITTFLPLVDAMSQSQADRIISVCNGPITAGSCSSPSTKWGFNAATLTCQAFSYNGCGGNSNRFDSEAICREYCNEARVTRLARCAIITQFTPGCRTADACTHDIHCAGATERCCHTQCYGKVCQAMTIVAASPTGAVRSGTCPSVAQQANCVAQSSCSSDSQCSTAGYKCCPGTCVGTVCMAPVTGSNQQPISTRPGTCPVAALVPGCTTMTTQCTSDDHCGTNAAYKCCPGPCNGILICTPPVSGTVVSPVTRPGVCPSLVRVPTCLIGNQCTSDNQCTGSATQKCCVGQCQGMQCMEPSSGTVPSTTVCNGVVCQPGQTCTLVNNVATCVVGTGTPGTITVNTGGCPYQAPTSSIAQCTSTCTNDSYCTGGRKCCQTGCSTRMIMQCLDPVASTSCRQLPPLLPGCSFTSTVQNPTTLCWSYTMVCP